MRSPGGAQQATGFASATPVPASRYSYARAWQPIKALRIGSVVVYALFGEGEDPRPDTKKGPAALPQVLLIKAPAVGFEPTTK